MQNVIEFKNHNLTDTGIRLIANVENHYFFNIEICYHKTFRQYMAEMFTKMSGKGYTVSENMFCYSLPELVRRIEMKLNKKTNLQEFIKWGKNEKRYKKSLSW